MPTNLTTNEIAESLRQAWARGPQDAAAVLGSHMAEMFEVHHHPGVPGDGPRPGAEYAADRANQVKAFCVAMPDYREEASITTNGDELTVQFSMAGTLPDGADLFYEVRAEYRTSDGEIIGVDAHPLTRDESGILFRALQLGGYEMPERMQQAAAERRAASA
jgi:hypothetical protein